ncbi:HAD family hydrolase [Caproiciproducens sp.]|uniref:HAD family hydrolase n=1 Tax=Caproiciproducens sp. TaxID=1954376 RepID=UPI00289E9D99|nr:HAD family hydrolase [Caproiciproducens sp.]
MIPKALILDIDGTLVDTVRHSVSDKTLKLINTLKKSGVTVIIASGRTDFAASPRILNGLAADYYVCVNGSHVTDGNGKIIYEDRFSIGQLTALWKFCESEGFPVAFSFEDAYYAYVKFREFRDYYRRNTGHASFILDGENHLRHLESLPFGAFACIDPLYVTRFSAEVPDLRLVPFKPGNYDVYKITTSKAHGIEQLLRKLHLNWDEVVAIGDSLNDMEMIQAAGIGVVMGNGHEDLKKSADFITKTVNQDGVAYAIEQIFQ